MSVNAELEALDGLKQFTKNLKTIKMQSPQFQFITITKLANLVLDNIHQKMRSAGFSEKIINGTTIDRIDIQSQSKAIIHFKSELFADNGYDIALGREVGTSKIQGLFIIRNTVNEIRDTLQDQYQLELIAWYGENLGE